jgi:hypothetical protein
MAAFADSSALAVDVALLAPAAAARLSPALPVGEQLLESNLYAVCDLVAGRAARASSARQYGLPVVAEQERTISPGALRRLVAGNGYSPRHRLLLTPGNAHGCWPAAVGASVLTDAFPATADLRRYAATGATAAHPRGSPRRARPCAHRCGLDLR